MKTVKRCEDSMQTSLKNSERKTANMVLVVVRLFELVNGKRNGEKETSSMQKWSKISVPTVCDLYHVQVNCSARMHNSK